MSANEMIVTDDEWKDEDTVIDAPELHESEPHESVADMLLEQERRTPSYPPGSGVLVDRTQASAVRSAALCAHVCS